MLNFAPFTPFTPLELVCFVCMFILCMYVIMRERKGYSPKTPQALQEWVPVFEGYSKDRPETWKCKFPNAQGSSQSPINIKTHGIMVIPSETHKPLVFNQQYFNLPKSITVFNDGYGGTCFDQDYPVISGGPLKSRYRFNLAQFRWGPTDFEGSEHTINSKRYAMELQLMHIKGEKIYENLDCAVKSQAVMFISYFFEITPIDNPYLYPITDALQHLQAPNQSMVIDPFPLCWLFHPFRSKFYFYQGSITFPPCTEGADWIIQSEPLSISSNQLRYFRTLRAVDGMMNRNTRPVQKINSRTVYFYE